MLTIKEGTCRKSSYKIQIAPPSKLEFHLSYKPIARSL